jgi:outer membrane protein TolC
MRGTGLLLLAAGLAACGAQPGLAQSPPLSLEQLYGLAEGRADSLRLRGLAVEKARGAAREARARARPKLSLEASGSWLASPPEGIGLAAGELGTLPGPTGPIPLPFRDLVFVEDAEHSYFSFRAALAQPLVTWGRIASGIRAADFELSACQAELQRQRLDLRQEVHRAFFAAQLANASLPLLEQLREALQLVVADRGRAADEGLDTRQPLLEAQADLAELERRLAESRESYRTALQSLALLCGVAPDFQLQETPFREQLRALDEEQLARSSAACSWELRLAELRRQQAQERVRAEQAASLFRPDLSLAASLEVNGQDIPWSSPDWTDSWDWDLRLGVGTKARLFDGGESGGRLEQARAEAEAAAAAGSQAEKLLRLRVRQAVQEARLAELELLERQARLAAAEERRRNAFSAYEGGLLGRADFQAALAGRLSAELELLSVRCRLELALAALERLAGPICPGSGS